MAANGLIEELKVSLPKRPSARRLAAELLRRSDLGVYYPPDFADHLAAGDDERQQRRTVRGWLRECGPFTPDGAGEEADSLYFALVFVSDSMASAFRAERPTGAGFESRRKAFTDALAHEQKELWDQRVGALPSLAERRLLPTMSEAINRGEAEFTLLAEVNAYQQEEFNDSELGRAVYAKFEPLIRRDFEAKHGRVTDEYWCAKVLAGVVKTDGGDRIYFDGNLPSQIDLMFNRCEGVRQRASEFLDTKEYETIVAPLYRLLTNLLGDVDAATKGRRKRTSDLQPELARAYTERIDALEERVEELAERRAQRWYAIGSGFGLLLLALILGPLIAVDLGHWSALFKGAIFGAAGAIGSVLVRMNRGKLRIHASRDKFLVAGAALVRPLMGALFGAVVTAIVLSEKLLPIEVPQHDPKRFYFLVVLAFAAGFSERWAPNLLETTTRQVTGGGSGEAPGEGR